MTAVNDWTSGYVTDIGYTHGYYSELNPLSLKLAFLNAGLVPPEVGHACELGFGQGLSTNIHAAASIVSWYGNDFNPTQTGNARELALASKTKIELADDSFADFVQRTDLPKFDFIGLHGIWSWVSDENRGHLVEFIRNNLNVGGVVYISYNSLPGWGAFAPIRYLMTEHAELIGANGQNIVGRIDEALEFTQKLLACNPSYAKANPGVLERMNSLKQQNRHYLAHEYFNRDWQPMSFHSVKEWLTPAKLTFACSANYLELVDEVNHSREQRELLSSINDNYFRETVKDFMVNQQFRRDYWVKGPRRLLPKEQLQMLRDFTCVLVVNEHDISLTFMGGYGEVNMSESIYNPIIDLLKGHKPTTLGELERKLQDTEISFPQIVQAVVVMSGLGYLAAVQDDAIVKAAKKSSEYLNKYLLFGVQNGHETRYLTSPLTGGGIAVNRIEQLFFSAYLDGKQKPKEMALSAWDNLKEFGQRLVVEGKNLESDDDNLKEMESLASSFFESRLPILKSLIIV